MKIKLLLIPISLICLFGLLLCGVLIFGRQSALASPDDLRFEVNPQYDLVYALGWEEGLPITLTVTNGDGDILTVITTTVGVLPWGPIGADFSFTEFDFQPNQILTAESEGLTRTYPVPNPILTEINIISDTIRGTGTPGDRMLVCANPDFYRWTTIDPSGNWMVDFTTPSDPGDTPGSRDLVPGSNGWADEFDAEGDQTWADDWRVPAPIIAANPVWNSVFATGMPIGTVLTLTVTVSGDVVYTSPPATVIEWPDNPGDISALFEMQGFDVAAGQMLTASAIDASTNYTVTNFAITGIDPLLDTVSGVATPESHLQICANLPDHCALRYLTADNSGEWTADFAHPGPGPGEGDIADIVPGSNGWGNEKDDSGNQTWSAWNVLNPSIYAHLNENRVDITEFPDEDSVEITIQGTDVYTTITGVTDLNGYTNFDLGWSFTLEPGQVITVTNDTITKTLTVMDLYVDLFDPLANTVSGHSDSNVELEVNVWADNGWQAVQSDATGSWTAIYDSSAGPWFPTTRGDVTSWDDDGDGTVYSFNTGNIFAWFPSTVELQNCMDYRNYTLTIDDPSNGPGMDYTDTRPPELIGTQVVATFPLTEFTIDAGDLITVTAGHDVRILVVAPKGDISFDVEHDIISGVNHPDRWVANTDAVSWRNVKTDSTGAWSIDYSVPDPNGEPVEDITYGLTGCLFQLDVDGDFTPFGWQVLAHIYLPSVYRLD